MLAASTKLMAMMTDREMERACELAGIVLRPGTEGFVSYWETAAKITARALLRMKAAVDVAPHTLVCDVSKNRSREKARLGALSHFRETGGLTDAGEAEYAKLTSLCNEPAQCTCWKAGL